MLPEAFQQNFQLEQPYPLGSCLPIPPSVFEQVYQVILNSFQSHFNLEYDTAFLFHFIIFAATYLLISFKQLMHLIHCPFSLDHYITAFESTQIL